MYNFIQFDTKFVYNENATLKGLILNLLKNIINEQDLYKYVDEKAMLIWEKALTPEITNPVNNYEELEYLGDRDLKVVYPKYLIQRFPYYNEKYITNIDTLIMEKKIQSEMSSKLNLVNFINMPKNQITTGIEGDVYESFFGALDTISDMIYPELGLINCYNMIVYMFNQIKIPDELKYGDPKMNVEQIFIKLGLEPLTTTIKKIGNMDNITLSLTKNHIDFFKQQRINIEYPILGVGEGYSKTIAMKNAYKNVKKNLEYYGVTDEFIDKIKTIRDQLKMEQKLLEDDVNKVKFVVEKEKIEVDIKAIVIYMLKQIISSETELNKYVTDKNMLIWNDVFNNIDNKLVYMGEIILKGLIPKHLMNIYKNYNKSNFNNILSKISKHYNLFLLNDIVKPLHNKINLEAFFGALDKVSETLLHGIGLVNCYRLITKIFVKDLIPIEFSVKHPKMLLDQLFLPFFSSKTAGKVVVKETYEDYVYTFDIMLSDEIFNFLKNLGFNIKTKHIGYSKGTLKKQTEKEAYADAIKFLDNYGITESWANITKIKMDFEHPELLKYKNAIEQKNKQLNYDYIYFSSPTKTATQKNVILQLIGVKNDNNKVILSSLSVPVTDANKINIKIALIKNYLSS